MNNSFLKCMFFIVIVLYIVSPIDVCAGSIDDIAVLFLGMSALKGIRKRNDI